MASMRACGEGAAQVVGLHMGGLCLQRCPQPFACRGQFPEGGGSSPGQTRTVVVPWSRGCHSSSVAGTRQATGVRGLCSPMEL